MIRAHLRPFNQKSDREDRENRESRESRESRDCFDIRVSFVMLARHHKKRGNPRFPLYCFSVDLVNLDVLTHSNTLVDDYLGRLVEGVVIDGNLVDDGVLLDFAPYTLI